MYDLLLIVHVVIAIAVIVLVLLQQGKGAEMGAAFGAGASQTLFGSQGSGNFLTRATAICATIFFITSLLLGYLAANQAKMKAEALLPVAPTTVIPAPVDNEPSQQKESTQDSTSKSAPSHSDVPDVE